MRRKHLARITLMTMALIVGRGVRSSISYDEESLSLHHFQLTEALTLKVLYYNRVEFHLKLKQKA